MFDVFLEDRPWAGVLAFLFLIPACAGSVTQDPPIEPGPLGDASADAPADAEGDASATVIGKACAVDSDCGDEARCQPNTPSGYCVLDCGGGMVCPDGTLCSPMPLSRVAGVCMLGCTSNADCRPEYVCDVVQLFPGDPNSPMSPGKVCWVPPPP